LIGGDFFDLTKQSFGAKIRQIDDLFFTMREAREKRNLNTTPCLEMARPRRGAVEELKLTLDERQHLGDLLDLAKSKEQSGDIPEAIRLYTQVKEEAEAIKAHQEQEKRGTKTESILSLEGKEINLEQELKYWQDFYEKQGIDWIELPKEIKLTKEQKEQLEAGARALCPEGEYDKLKLLIIPANLADTGERYAQIHEKMSQGYAATFEGSNFTEDGSFSGLKNKSNELRLILTKDIQNLADDELYKSTKGKSVDDLEADGSIFKTSGLRGLDIATYLVQQREYFERTEKHLDEDGYTWLTEHERPASGRVPSAGWFPDFSQLSFDAYSPDGHHDDLGCRLSSSLVI